MCTYFDQFGNFAALGATSQFASSAEPLANDRVKRAKLGSELRPDPPRFYWQASPIDFRGTSPPLTPVGGWGQRVSGCDVAGGRSGQSGFELKPNHFYYVGRASRFPAMAKTL